MSFIEKKVTIGNDFIKQSSLDGDDCRVESFSDCYIPFFQNGVTCITFCHIVEKIANPSDNGYSRFAASPVLGTYYGAPQTYYAFDSSSQGEMHCYKIPGIDLMLVSLKEVNCDSMSVDNQGIKNNAYCNGFLIYSFSVGKVIGGNVYSFDM